MNSIFAILLVLTISAQAQLHIGQMFYGGVGCTPATFSSARLIPLANAVLLTCSEEGVYYSCENSTHWTMYNCTDNSLMDTQLLDTCILGNTFQCVDTFSEFSSAVEAVSPNNIARFAYTSGDCTSDDGLFGAVYNPIGCASGPDVLTCAIDANGVNIAEITCEESSTCECSGDASTCFCAPADINLIPLVNGSSECIPTFGQFQYRLTTADGFECTTIPEMTTEEMTMDMTMTMTGEDMTMTGEDMTMTGEDMTMTGEDMTMTGDDMTMTGEDMTSDDDDMTSDDDDMTADDDDTTEDSDEESGESDDDDDSNSMTLFLTVTLLYVSLIQ